MQEHEKAQRAAIAMRHPHGGPERENLLRSLQVQLERKLMELKAWHAQKRAAEDQRTMEDQRTRAEQGMGGQFPMHQVTISSASTTRSFTAWLVPVDHFFIGNPERSRTCSPPIPELPKLLTAPKQSMFSGIEKARIQGFGQKWAGIGAVSRSHL
jgi:hypothetical protein